MTKLQLIGGGKMGMALFSGIVASGWAQERELAVIETSPSQQAVIAAAHPLAMVLDTPLPEVDTILAVKPWAIIEVAASLVRPGRVVSVAAGVTVAALEAAVPNGTCVLRTMPNTPALVGAGATAVVPGSAATVADVDWAVELLGSVGIVEVVTEAQINAVTGVSGSGPAYVFLIAEALIDAGVRAGLTRDVATRLANQTILGAGLMLTRTGDSAVELRAAVTTPGGTTAAGLAALERHGARATMAAAVEAAVERSREMASE